MENFLIGPGEHSARICTSFFSKNTVFEHVLKPPVTFLTDVHFPVHANVRQIF